MRYETILLDLDHCLLDSDESERRAFEDTLQSVGIAPTPEHMATYARLNAALWSAVEQGDLTPNDVRHRRWREFVDAARVDADPLEMSDRFVEGLGAFGELYPGAERMLTEIESGRRLGLVTNGIGIVQRTRIERLGLDRFFSAYVISGEAGVAKPSRAIFERIAADLGGVDPVRTVMIGDSLTSDIAGGRAFGIDTCWFNPRGKAAPTPPPTHTVGTLGEIPQLV